MKKLLSILASLVVAGSSASTVVACGEGFGLNNGNKSNNNGGNWYPDNSDNDGYIPGQSVNPDKKPNNSNNNGEHNIPDSHNHNDNTKNTDPVFNQQDAQDFAEKKILQDQFGIDGNYLNNELSLGKNVDGTNSKVVNMNDKGKYGASAFPLIDWLHDNGVVNDSLYTTLGTVLPIIFGPKNDGNGGIELPNPSQLAATLKFALPALPALSGTIKNLINGVTETAKDSDGNVVKNPDETDKIISGKDAINDLLKPILNQQVGSIVTDFIKTGKNISSNYEGKTIGSSMDSFVVSLAYILTRAEGADNYRDYSKPWEANLDLVNKADDAIAKAISDLISNKKMNFAVLLDNEGIQIISDAVKLFSMYVEQFDSYRASNEKLDSAHVFADPDNAGKILANYDVVNKIRNKTINIGNFQFNLLKFVSEISYYLGSLDKPEGIFKFQALLAMFFLDDDKSSASNFLINWDDNGDGVTGWDETVDGVSKNATPISKLIMKVIGSVLSGLLPSNLESSLSSAGVTGVTNAGIVNFAKRTVYIILQSLTWNKGFRLSNEKFLHFSKAGANADIRLSDLYNGIDIKILNITVLSVPGLKEINEWTSLQNEGILNYLYDGNIYELLDEFKKNENFASFFGKILTLVKTFVKDASIPSWDDIKNKINNIQTMMMPYSEQAINSETVKLSEKVGDFSTIKFESKGKKSVLNTSLDLGKSTTDGQDATSGRLGSSSGVPKITNVVKTSFNPLAGEKGQTTLNVSATNILKMSNSDGKDVQKFNHYSGGPSGNPDVADTSTDFAHSISVEGFKVVSASLIGDLSGKDKDYSGTFSVVVDGNVTESNTKVTAYGWRYNGYDGFFKTTAEYYNQCKETYDTVNMVWSGEDELNMSDTLGWDFTKNDWKGNTDFVLSMTDAKRLSDLKVIGIKDGKESNDLIKSRDPKTGPSVDIQLLASKSLSALLGAFGLAPFDNSKGPLGLAVTNDNSVGGLILKIGGLINENISDVKSLDNLNNLFDLDKLQNLVNIIFGIGTDSNGNERHENVVARLLDVLTGPSGSLSAGIQNILGAKGSEYSRDGLLGALIDMFTPNIGMNGAYIVPDATADTPLWDYLFHTIKSAWMLANSNENKALLNELNDSKNYKFDWDHKVVSKDDQTITVTITYSYKYTRYVKTESKDKDSSGKETTTTVITAEDAYAKGTYTLVITDNGKDKNGNQKLPTYVITRNN